jgi:multiple sugar transport system ATP-binding protein
MARVELDHVTKRFADGTAAVDDVSLAIEDGEFFVIVGPSGCGKSTLLAAVCGLETITSGEIRVDGVRVNDRQPKDRNMAMVFQSYALYPHLTVRENLAFPLRLARMPAKEIGERVARMSKMLDLADLLDRKPGALSGGQRQRVAMGRALAREPAAFLLDEPLSNLDSRLRERMRGELALLQRRLGTTTLYVTHDQLEAMTLADRLAIMRGGRALQIGTPRDIYERPADLFVAQFLGAPPMNVVPAEIGERVVLPFGELIPRAGPLANGKAIVGIRPEHILLGSGDGEALSFTATAEVVEWTGADLLVTLVLAQPATAQTVRMVARFSGAEKVARGARLELSVPVAALHVFDAVSGARLG